MIDKGWCEVVDTGIFSYNIRHIGSERVIDAGWCEVPHMAKAYVQVALRYGATGATLVPYTGWDCIWPFLDAGLVAYVYRMDGHWPLLGWPRLWRCWQQKARRKYGLGRLLLWPRGGAR